MGKSIISILITWFKVRGRMGRVFAGTLVLLLSLLMTGVSLGADRVDPVTLDQEIQQIKNDILTLGSDLAMLDSGILSIAGNPLIIYVSLNTDEGFELQAVDLELNEQFVSRKEFNERALQGMKAGGIRRLYVENLPAGKYRFKVSLYGKVGKDRDHRGSLSFTIDKTERPKTLELKIVNFRQKYVPEIEIKEWK